MNDATFKINSGSWIFPMLVIFISQENSPLCQDCTGGMVWLGSLKVYWAHSGATFLVLKVIFSLFANEVLLNVDTQGVREQRQRLLGRRYSSWELPVPSSGAPVMSLRFCILHCSPPCSAPEFPCQSLGKLRTGNKSSSRVYVKWGSAFLPLSTHISFHSCIHASLHSSTFHRYLPSIHQPSIHSSIQSPSIYPSTPLSI